MMSPFCAAVTGVVDGTVEYTADEDAAANAGTLGGGTAAAAAAPWSLFRGKVSDTYAWFTTTSPSPCNA